MLNEGSNGEGSSVQHFHLRFSIQNSAFSIARTGVILALQMRLFAAAALVALSSLAPAAQTHPDLSGRWTTDPIPPSDAAARGAAPQGQRGAPGTRPDLGSGWGSTITLTQDARQLTVEYAFFTRGDMQPPLKFAYALDGSESRNPVRMGRGMQTERAKSAWDGQALVITTTHDYKDPSSGKAGSIDVVRRLSLESPDSLVVETTRAGALGGPSSTTRVVYRRLA